MLPYKITPSRLAQSSIKSYQNTMKYKENEPIIEYPNCRVFQPFDTIPINPYFPPHPSKPLINQAFPDIIIIIEYYLNGIVPNLTQKSYFNTLSAAVLFTRNFKIP